MAADGILTVTFRLVGLRHETRGGYHCYLTDLPPEACSPPEMSVSYRIHGAIELLFGALESRDWHDDCQVDFPVGGHWALRVSTVGKIILTCCRSIHCRAHRESKDEFADL